MTVLENLFSGSTLLIYFGNSIVSCAALLPAQRQMYIVLLICSWLTLLCKWSMQ